MLPLWITEQENVHKHGSLAWIDADGAENIIILHHKQALLSTQCRIVGLEDNPRIHAVQIITDSTAKTSIIVHTFRRFKWV